MGKTSLVTALRDDNGAIYAIVDEDGKTVPMGATEASIFSLAANYVLSEQDNHGIIVNNTATPRTVTVPAGLPHGFSVQIVQKGAGAVTVAAGAGATVTSKDGFTKTNGANTMLAVTNSGVVDDYLLTGQGVA